MAGIRPGLYLAALWGVFASGSAWAKLAFGVDDFEKKIWCTYREASRLGA